MFQSGKTNKQKQTQQTNEQGNKKVERVKAGRRRTTKKTKQKNKEANKHDEQNLRASLSSSI